MQDKKSDVIKLLRQMMGLLVDKPKLEGSGSTNDAT